MGVANRIEGFDAGVGSKRPQSGLRHEEPPTPTVTEREWKVARPIDATLASPKATHVVVDRRPGERLGGGDGERFEVLERLGGGGMSIVFLARDTVLHRMVAIKFLTSGGLDTAEALERIRLEARACARLNHENIVRLFDMGTDAGTPFLVMEHLDGRSLDAMLRDERLDTQRAVRIAIDVCRGLSQAHRMGIVHRDLKPSNIFITRDGTVKILDFGVASVADVPDSEGEGFAGTPAYMSPEQWNGQAQDGRTDLWALGVVLFELLTGLLPFSGGSLAALRDAVVAPTPAPSVRHARPDLPAEAEDIVRRALQKDPDARYGTADELLYGLLALEIALSRLRVFHKRQGRSEPAVRSKRPKPDRRQITILSCSLDGAPELSGDSVLDDIDEVLSEFLEMGTTVVRQLEGTLLTSIGPRIVACFGYPMVHEDHAQRALRAASLMVEAIAGCATASAARLAVRIGIDTSVAIVNGIDGSATPQNLLGDAPRVAQWLEQRAGPNEILVGPLSQVLVRNVFHLASLGEASFDGGARSIRIHRVICTKEAPCRFDPVASGALTPFVGRDEELEGLRALWDQARAGNGQLALIVGEPGIGKSRLLEHHLTRTANAPRHIVRCQCWAYFRNSALQPISEGLLSTFGVRSETSKEKLTALEAALAEISPPSTSAHGSLDLASITRETLDAWVVLFLRLAKRRPTILVVEDAHWSDDSTLELLRLLLAAMAKARLMIVVTARPDFREPWSRHSHLRRFALARLSAQQTATMIAFASQGRNLPPPIVAQLVQRADGVPLFIEELTHRVADALGEAGPEDAARAGGALSTRIPATLEASLRARLDVLPQDAQDVAQLVAVLDRDAGYDVMAKVWEHAEESLRTGLRQLVEADILRRGDEGDGPCAARYRFKHVLVKDAAYQSLTKGKRRALHRRAAEVLIEHAPRVGERNPELLAAHFVEGGCHEDAVVYFHRAGERALARSANVDAAAHCRRAIAQLRHLPEGRARDQRELALHLALGRALLATNWSTDIRRVYARIRELGRDEGGDGAGADGAGADGAGGALPFPSLLGLWRFYSLAGEIALAAELGRQLMAHAQMSADPGAMLLAHIAMGMRSILEGDFEGCQSHEKAARSFYDEQAHGELAFHAGVDPWVDSGMCLACSSWVLGRADEALRYATDAVRQARRKKHVFSLALALLHLGNLHNCRGEHDLARKRADEASRLGEEHGLDAVLALAKVVRGWSRRAKGARGAVREIREGLTGQLESGRMTAITLCYMTLAWAQWKDGELDEGLRTIDEAMVLVAKGERTAEVELLRLRGEILLAKGADPSSVLELFERGLVIAQGQRATGWALRLSHSYARLLARLSRTAEAKAALAPALAALTEGRDTADVREARAFLDSLELCEPLELREPREATSSRGG
ncbi:protein kinase domain-containing protein [Pendulispora albinea]|uniref:Protein kinase n=1 Tax=Pendulispora albinea TaxID=2741071 RepID=A0ABZ2M643_9BACT